MSNVFQTFTEYSVTRILYVKIILCKKSAAKACSKLLWKLKMGAIYHILILVSTRFSHLFLIPFATVQCRGNIPPGGILQAFSIQAHLLDCKWGQYLLQKHVVWYSKFLYGLLAVMLARGQIYLVNSFFFFPCVSIKYSKVYRRG